MQIIIPMSGFGERFRKAGYDIPKPLIEVEGKPIIGHVIDMFPGEKNFVFICNQDHLNNKDYRMRETLTRLCPTGQIYSIPAHKLGPVHAVLEAEDLIDDDTQTIVNYCDFTCYWNWSHFKNFVLKNDCDGAIPSYKGFHPHSLGSTNYAYLKEINGWVEDIQEKQPFTDNKMMEYASSGTYYFSSGNMMKEAFRKQVKERLELNGEYYASLAYKPLLKERKRISIYPLQHFMQWGTPEDLREYNYWSETFKSLSILRDDLVLQNGSTIIPMAGLGKRFKDEGYIKTKPLIEVSGDSMVSKATADLPSTPSNVFVLRSDMSDCEIVTSELLEKYPESIIKKIDHITDGQAITASIGFNALMEDDSANTDPITFGVCDSGVIYNNKDLQVLLERDDVDVIVWTIRGYPNASRNPEMYGWIQQDSNEFIKHISVKEPLCDTLNDPIVLGVFTFKNPEDFKQSFESLLKREGKINDEYYLDSCIEDAIKLGLNCAIFEVDHFLCWGTPNDLKTFQYWQSCFHLWQSHDYNIEKDQRIPKTKTQSLKEQIEKNDPTLFFSLGENE